MKEFDQLNESEKAWLLYKKIAELQLLIRENYYMEFLWYEKQEKEKNISETYVPF